MRGSGGFGGRVDVVDPLTLGTCGGQEPDGQVAAAVGERYPTAEAETPRHVVDTWVSVLKYLQSLCHGSGRPGDVSQIELRSTDEDHRLAQISPKPAGESLVMDGLGLGQSLVGQAQGGSRAVWS